MQSKYLSNVLRINLLALFVLIAGLSFGQAASGEYKAENEGWLVNVDEAYAESKKTGKPILANFTGSDWCGWCKRLTKSVFIHDEFKTWAEENVVLLELDFPRRKQLPADIRAQNRSLQKAFAVRGYPTVWLFDLEQKDDGEMQVSKLAKTGYTKTVAEFTAGLNKALAQRTAGE